MAFRNDVSIDWSVSPRIVTVASPSTEITIQDLYDTCMTLEALPDAVDNEHIIDAAGKEELGGGTSVGLTATFLNALVEFEARPGPTWTLCNVNGGNLVALEADLITYYTSPINPTAFVTVNTTASSSATLSEGGGTIDVASIFNEDLTPYTTPGTFGEWINNKGLTALKFMGLK